MGKRPPGGNSLLLLLSVAGLWHGGQESKNLNGRAIWKRQ